MEDPNRPNLHTAYEFVQDLKGYAAILQGHNWVAKVATPEDTFLVALQADSREQANQRIASLLDDRYTTPWSVLELYGPSTKTTQQMIERIQSEQ